MFDYVGSDIILYYTNKYCSILSVLILILIIILCINIFHFNDNGSSVWLLYVYVNYKCNNNDRVYAGFLFAVVMVYTTH